MKETDLAKQVIEYIQGLNWQVWQEVQIDCYGAIADIVARQGNIVWIVETKTSFNFTVLAQAAYWKPYTHYVSIAAPTLLSANSKTDKYRLELLAREGIGYLRVGQNVHELVSPRFNRKAFSVRIVEKLKDIPPDFCEAGASGGGHYTPFANTVRRIKNYIRCHPGCTMKQILDNVSTHYASIAGARTSLTHYLKEGLIKGVLVRREGNRNHYFLENEQ